MPKLLSLKWQSVLLHPPIVRFVDPSTSIFGLEESYLPVSTALTLVMRKNKMAKKSRSRPEQPLLGNLISHKAKSTARVSLRRDPTKE
jgi:hypothetical protein